MSVAIPRILYLASSNAGKLREFRQAAPAFGIEVRALPNMDSVPPSPEEGTTFEENARQKALYYSQFSREMIFADDSGIAVDVLGGAPGIRSARYAGPGATDAENNTKLRRRLARHAGVRWSAHYDCAIALAVRGRLLGVFQGTTSGEILEKPRGSGGFGYDPYFYYPPLGKTFAELTPDEKFQVSHRGHAFRKLLDFLASRNAAAPLSG